jgi:ribonuclease III
MTEAADASSEQPVSNSEAEQPESEAREALEGALGFTFSDAQLLDLALTHRSFAFEESVGDTNERLEFLGDAVLQLRVTDLVFERFPTHPEGDLAKLRASLVSEPALSAVAGELGLGKFIKLGRGESQSGGSDKPSIKADTFEAVLGAVYLDGGIEGAREVIDRIFAPLVEDAVGKEVPKDPKTRLQELVTRQHGSLPRYNVTGSGPDHAKQFVAEVFISGEMCGKGEGRSKREAEQAAALKALSAVGDERGESDA